MAIIFLHVLVCIMVAVAFLTRTEFSMLGNIWTALAQLAQSEHVQEVLQQDVTLKTDDEVERMFRDNNVIGRRYRPDVVEEDRSMAILPVKKDEAEYLRLRHVDSISSDRSA
jgi:hypothetical protein